jgi:hypothetical protein
MVFDVKNPFVLSVWGCRKVHKVYLNMVYTSIGNNWFQRTMGLIGLVEGTGGTAIDDPFAIVLRNAVDLWDNKLICMLDAAMVIVDMGLGNGIECIPLASGNAIGVVNLTEMC